MNNFVNVCIQTIVTEIKSLGFKLKSAEMKGSTHMRKQEGGF